LKSTQAYSVQRFRDDEENKFYDTDKPEAIFSSFIRGKFWSWIWTSARLSVSSPGSYQSHLIPLILLLEVVPYHS